MADPQSADAQMAAAQAGGGGSKEPTEPPCTRLIDAFANFAYDDAHGFTFDVFVEADLDQVRSTANGLNHTRSVPVQLQINQVRKFFSHCILSKQCSIRVHWSDPQYLDFHTFARTHPSANRDDLGKDNLANLTTYKHRAFQKEMAKANVANMLREWPDWVREYANREEFDDDLEATYLAHRVMMDFYSMSRIMKQSTAEDPNGKLCNVIYYAGYHHTQFAARICQHLGFTEEWTMGENPCFSEGSSVRQLPLGVRFEPAAVWTGERRPRGEDAREAFNTLCIKHFGSKRLVAVKHSARWFNEKTGQTIYFVGELHTGDRGEEPISKDRDVVEPSGNEQDVEKRTKSNRQLNIDQRNDRVKVKAAKNRFMYLSDRLHFLEAQMKRNVAHMKRSGQIKDYRRSLLHLTSAVQLMKCRIATARAYPAHGDTDPRRIAYDADIKRYEDVLISLEDMISRKRAETTEHKNDHDEEPKRVEKTIANPSADSQPAFKMMKRDGEAS